MHNDEIACSWLLLTQGSEAGVINSQAGWRWGWEVEFLQGSEGSICPAWGCDLLSPAQLS